MSNKDLFAPPSKQEVDSVLNAPPSPEELAALDNSPKHQGAELDPIQAKELLDKPLEAASQGFANNASLGFADELGALAQKGLDASQTGSNKLTQALKDLGLPVKVDPKGPSQVNEEMQQQGFQGKDLEDPTYNQLVAENQARRELLKKYNPRAYGTGSVAGIAATLPLGLGAEGAQAVRAGAEALPLVGKAVAPLAAPALEGLGLGAMSAAGDSQGSLSQDPMQLATDSLKGGGLGLGIGAGAGMLGNSFAKSEKQLQKEAQLSALPAFGLTAIDTKKLAMKDKQELGQAILDNKLITPMSGPGEALEKLKQLREAKEKELGDTLGSLTNVLGPNRKKLADSIKDKIKKDNPYIPKEDRDKMLEKVDEWVLQDPNELSTSLNVPSSELQGKKVALNDYIKPTGFNNDTPSNLLQTYIDIRQGYRKSLENMSDEASQLPGNEALNLGQTNKELGQFYKLEDSAEKAANKDLYKSDIGPSTKLGVIGSALKGDLGGAIAGLGLDSLASNSKNIKALSYQKAANMAGNATPLVEKAERVSARLAGGDAPADVHTVSDKTPDQLKALSQQSLAKYGNKAAKLAQVLDKAADRPEQSRKALMFSLMQNPEYRTMLNELNAENKK